MSQIFIGVGSNIEPEESIPHALDLLKQAMHVTGISTFYRTPALGNEEQPPFYNGVIAAETDFPPGTVKVDTLQDIEERLGRRRCEDRYAPRTIDLDLILYDDLIVEEADLILPDPEIIRRAFLAVPLCELAPELTLPDGRSICAVAGELAAQPLEPLPEFTESLRLRI
ncbi:MAG: 2-amino-4-hydroxy-6-hydroxymethyldihydropteridine diphosphokinase [Armatimonadota bacterium]